MTAYNMGLSEKLVCAAEAVLQDSDGDFDSSQAVSYLSLLACEIAMKSLLEKAGFSPKAIRGRSHNLSRLLRDFCDCEITQEETRGKTRWRRAVGIRGKPVQTGTIGTVGKVLDGESNGASPYPNQIRYGSQYSHFTPEVLLETAKQVVAWSHEHWESIRVVKEQREPNDTF